MKKLQRIKVKTELEPLNATKRIMRELGWSPHYKEEKSRFIIPPAPPKKKKS